MIHQTCLRLSATITGFTLLAMPAQAHHPLGGGSPDTLFHGIASGIGHPVIGLDHLTFIIAMGLVAASLHRLATAPLAFLATATAGVMLVHAGISIPGVELLVAPSVILAGCIVMSGRKFSLPVILGLFAIAGLVHGAAFGAAIVGAEQTPLAGYLAGLAFTQYAIAVGAGALSRVWFNSTNAQSVQLRIAGGAIAGIGVAIVFELAEGALLPALT